MEKEEGKKKICKREQANTCQKGGTEDDHERGKGVCKRSGAAAVQFFYSSKQAVVCFEAVGEMYIRSRNVCR